MKNKGRAIEKIIFFMGTIIITIFACFLFFLAGEGFMRLWNKYHIVYDIEMWKYARLLKKESKDPILKHEHQPGEERLMNVSIKINSQGLRDYEYSHEKPPRTYRILVLGDSLTLGWGVELEKTYPKLLEKLLIKKKPLRSYVKYEVINTGGGNWNTVQECRFYELEGRRYNPDLIIIGFCINDAETATRYRYYNNFLVQSYFFINIWSKWNQIAVHLGIKEGYREYYLNLYKDGKSRGWLAAKKALRDIATFNKKRKIKTLIVILPELHQLGENYPFKKIHKLVSKAGREMGISVFDLLEDFKGQNPQDLWGAMGDTHPNDKAHEIIARAIYKYLNTSDLLK